MKKLMSTVTLIAASAVMHHAKKMKQEEGQNENVDSIGMRDKKTFDEMAKYLDAEFSRAIDKMTAEKQHTSPTNEKQSKAFDVFGKSLLLKKILTEQKAAYRLGKSQTRLADELLGMQKNTNGEKNGAMSNRNADAIKSPSNNCGSVFIDPFSRVHQFLSNEKGMTCPSQGKNALTRVQEGAAKRLDEPCGAAKPSHVHPFLVYLDEMIQREKALKKKLTLEKNTFARFDEGSSTSVEELESRVSNLKISTRAIKGQEIKIQLLIEVRHHFHCMMKENIVQ